MGFFKKIFGSGIETVSAGPGDVTSVPTASDPALGQAATTPASAEASGFANAERLAADCRFAEALTTIDDFLALPSDAASANASVQALLQEESSSGRGTQSPANASMQDVLASLTHKHDGTVAAMMAFRSKCLANLLKANAKGASSYATGTLDLTAIKDKANTQIQLASDLFAGDIPNLAWATALCHLLGDSQRGHDLLQRIAEGIPDKTAAAAMLKMAAKRMDDIHNI